MYHLKEGDQFCGSYTMETLPNDFLRTLAREADKYGDATGIDEDGCRVTILADEDNDEYGEFTDQGWRS